MEDTIKEKSRNNRQIMFLVLLAVAIGAIMFASITLVRNAEEIRSDPVEYAVSNNLYESCTCYKSDFGTVVFGDILLVGNKEPVIQNRTNRNN